MLARVEAAVARRPRVAAAIVATLVGAAALGAYAHWMLWQAMDALFIFLAAGALVIGALILATIPKPVVRRLSLFSLVAAVGLLLGQWVGPSRPALRDTGAEVTATLERPAFVTGEGRGWCETATGSELRVAGNLRLQIRADDPSAPADIDQREFVDIYLTVGDRWRDGAIHRSDNVDLAVSVGSVAADEPAVALAADDGSLIDLAWTEEAGSLRFDRLVVDHSRNGASGAPVDLAGTISWICRDRPLPDGAAEIADTACTESTYAVCVEDLLRAMVEMPGSLVAVCDFGDGTGRVIPLERAEDAAGWCAEEAPAGRVVEVVRLPEE
jgi:hypothetical protein